MTLKDTVEMMNSDITRRDLKLSIISWRFE